MLSFIKGFFKKNFGAGYNELLDTREEYDNDVELETVNLYELTIIEKFCNSSTLANRLNAIQTCIQKYRQEPKTSKIDCFPGEKSKIISSGTCMNDIVRNLQKSRFPSSKIVPIKDLENPTSESDMYALINQGNQTLVLIINIEKLPYEVVN